MKAPKPPKPPPTPPMPTEQQADLASESEMRRQRRRSGFESTFLTGLLTPKPRKQITLGSSRLR